MGILLGYVVDIVVGAVMDMDVIDNQMKSKVIRALNKVVWIQNDLFARHYITRLDDKGVVTPPPELVIKAEEKSVGSGCPFSH